MQYSKSTVLPNRGRCCFRSIEHQTNIANHIHRNEIKIKRYEAKFQTDHKLGFFTSLLCFGKMSVLATYVENILDSSNRSIRAFKNSASEIHDDALDQ